MVKPGTPLVTFGVSVAPMDCGKPKTYSVPATATCFPEIVTVGLSDFTDGTSEIAAATVDVGTNTLTSSFFTGDVSLSGTPCAVSVADPVSPSSTIGSIEMFTSLI